MNWNPSEPTVYNYEPQTPILKYFKDFKIKYYDKSSMHHTLFETLSSKMIHKSDPLETKSKSSAKT